MTEEVPHIGGEFRVIKMDDMFHVVFRPDTDPEWFRIIASFYTYDRAWGYCDVERATVYDDSWTRDETPYRQPPVIPASDQTVAVEIARHVLDPERKVPALPYDEMADAPHDSELPKDYHERIADIEPAPVIVPDVVEPAQEIRSSGGEEELTPSQAAVMTVLAEAAGPDGNSQISLTKMSREARVPHGSITFLLDSLERKGKISVVVRGKHGTTTIYRVANLAEWL